MFPSYFRNLPAPAPAAMISCGFLAGPWFYGINHWLLALLFRAFPPTDPRLNFAEYFIHNHLISGWLIAAACFCYWSLRDERTSWRRARILEASLACIVAVFFTLALRPLIGAPSPARVPGFQELYPQYLWNFGSDNSLPSHSTLVYFTMAAGLWPINRKISAALCGWVLLTVSLPRVYIGGHYPSDVAASMVVAVAFLWLAYRIGTTRRGMALLERASGGGFWMELLMFLWLFELGEAFRSAGELAISMVRLVLYHRFY